MGNQFMNRKSCSKNIKSGYQKEPLELFIRGYIDIVMDKTEEMR